MIPKTRTAMKCLNEPYSCLWPKSANSNVEIAFLISPKYGRLHSFKVAHNWNWILPVYVWLCMHNTVLLIRYFHPRLQMTVRGLQF